LIDRIFPFCYNTCVKTTQVLKMKLHITTTFFVTYLNGDLAFSKRRNEYFYIPDNETYKKHFRKDWKMLDFVLYQLGPKIVLNNKTIQANPNRYGEMILWQELVDNDFLTDSEQRQLRRYGEIVDPTPIIPSFIPVPYPART